MRRSKYCSKLSARRCAIYNAIDGLAGENRAGLLFVDSYGHRRDYTLAEVSDQSKRYAAALRALGAGECETALLCTSNSAKTLFVMLALERLGVRAAPCAQNAQARQLLDLARATNAAMVIANRTRRAEIEALQKEMEPSVRYVLMGEECEGWARLDTLAEAAKPYAAEEPRADVPAVDDAVLLALSAQSDDRVWSALPMDGRSWAAYVQAPWLCGAATIVHEGAFDPRERLDLARELEVTVLCQHPEEFSAQVDLQDVDRFRLPYLRRCVATAPVGVDIERRWTERFGVPLYSLRSGFTTSERPSPEAPFTRSK